MKKVFWWILAILWCGMIFYQSSKPAVRSSLESGYITSLLNSFMKSLFGEGRFTIQNNFIRKSAHFLEYLVLGSLLFNALKNSERLKKTFILSVVLALIYAISDEVHQYFIPGRAMRAFDVGVDFLGIILGTGILFICSKKKLINYI